MENIQSTNKIQKNIIDMEQFKKAKETFVKSRLMIKKFFNKKNNTIIGIFISIILIFGVVYMGITTFQNYSQINKNAKILENINQYKTDTLKNNQLTRNIIATSSTLYDIIEANKNLKDEIERYEIYKENLQYPYTYFLQYLLLPKLNIRKNSYTEELSINILGKNFLDKNPYNDINLMQKRVDFFSNTNQNELNQIKDIKIGDINEYENWLFWIKMNINFIAPSQKALISLTDKITTTSDNENIGLLWEFFYHLREQIKEDKKDIIDKKIQEGILWGETNKDKIIGFMIYQRVFNDIEENIIDNTTINRTIFSMMGCSPESEVVCFYKFRENYRNISNIAYTIWIKDNENKSEEFKTFLKNLPPLIAVQEFVFDQIQDNSLIKNNIKFNGKISLEIFWQSITEEERNEIAKALGKKCFWEEKIISREEAITIIDENIRKKINFIEWNQSKSNNIFELKGIIEKIGEEFDWLNNYKKTIRLFEIYRMLNENWICKTI